MSQPHRPNRGFTLIELLVVIAIIGILLGLLLPAVQKVREASNRIKCKNNLKQMALACQLHESTLSHFPAAGINYTTSGDPTKGFGITQPGGWHYNILPFIEQSSLHDLGIKAGTDALRREAGKQICGVVLSVYICPTRGKAVPYPYTLKGTRYGFSNINQPDMIARSDYAANGGNAVSGWTNYNSYPLTGIIYRDSVIRSSQIVDGLSSTYLIGERYINPDFYIDGNSSGNDQGWTTGHDFDVFRATDYQASDPTTSSKYAPRRDRAGIEAREQFGSAHDMFNMALCDGSVKGFRYTIDPVMHYRLGNRNDGQKVDTE